MFGYRKYRSYRGKRYGSYSRRYGGAASSAALARRVTRSAQAGTRKVVVNIPRTFDSTFSINAGEYTSSVIKIRPTATGVDLSTLPYMDTYEAYSRLYDECRIVGVKMKFLFGDPLGTLRYFTLYTAVDRKTMWGNPQSGTSEAMTAAEVIGGSSVIKTDFSVEKSLITYRSVWASNANEKSVFWDTGIAVDGTTTARSIPGLIYNPVCFHPTIYAVLQAGAAPSSAGTVSFRLNIEWILEFRNPKLSIPSTAAKSTEAVVMRGPAFGTDTVIESIDGVTTKLSVNKEEEQPAMAAAEEGTS